MCTCERGTERKSECFCTSEWSEEKLPTTTVACIYPYQHVFCIWKRNLILTWFLSWWWNIFLFYTISSHRSLHPVVLGIAFTKQSNDITQSAHYPVKKQRCHTFDMCACVTWNCCMGQLQWGSHTTKQTAREKNMSETWQIGLNLLKILCIWLKLRDKNCSHLIEAVNISSPTKV